MILSIALSHLAYHIIKENQGPSQPWFEARWEPVLTGNGMIELNILQTMSKSWRK